MSSQEAQNELPGGPTWTVTKPLKVRLKKQGFRDFPAGLQKTPTTTPKTTPREANIYLPRGPKPTTDDTESGVRKSCCFNVPPALLRLSGGPTATLSRFPWSGGPTVNLSRFPSLGWSCGKSLVFSGVLVVLR